MSPTTALDVTVEAVVDLVKDLGEKYGIHVVHLAQLGLGVEPRPHLCDVFMEAVKQSIEDVLDKMRHPYTQALFRSIPLPGADKNALTLGDPQQFLLRERLNGCNFGPRCDYFEEGRCNATEIAMSELAGDDRHASRCLKFAEIDWDAHSGRQTV